MQDRVGPILLSQLQLTSFLDPRRSADNLRECEQMVGGEWRRRNRLSTAHQFGNWIFD